MFFKFLLDTFGKLQYNKCIRRKIALTFKLKLLIGSNSKGFDRAASEMEEHGLVLRTIYPEVPLRVGYSLTELERSLKPIFDSMQVWGRGIKKKRKYNTSIYGHV